MKEHFDKVLGMGGASENPSDLEAYSYDGSELPGKARLVLFPSSDEQLRMILSYCNRSNLDITIRGNASNTVGGATPQNSIVLCTQNFDRIHAINVRDSWVHVDCGVTIADLNEALRSQGLRYALETTSKKLNTIGGLLARNGLSKYGATYGRPADTVLELEIMDGTGKYFTVKGDVTDYLGFEGSIFFLIRAKLKVIPITERSADVHYCETLPEAIEQIHAALEHKPLAIEFLDSISATYAGLNTKHTVIVEYEHDNGGYKYENYASLMHKRDNARRAVGMQGFILMEDGRVPQEKLLEAIDWCIRHELPVVAHASVGVVHPFFKREQSELRDQWSAWVVAHDGDAAGQAGFGLRKKQFVSQAFQKKIRQLKERYDYNNILGRGKLYDFV